MRDFFQLMEAALDQGDDFALAIISGIKGSSPQKKGAKAIFYGDGRIDGTLGGGCLEAEVQQRARQAIATQTPEAFELVLDHDFGWDDGLICGGKVTGLILPHAAGMKDLWRHLSKRDREMTWGVRPDFSIQTAERETGDWLYRETVLPPCALWIAGAGHVAQAVTPLALKLDFEVSVFDDRPALANHRFFPPETQFQTDYWENLLGIPLPNRPTFGLIVTRGHQHDARVLRHWLQQPFAFLGMIGSQRKKRLIFDQFLAEGLATSDQLARVACPVGLEILSQSVDEIALSIMAQIVRLRGEKVYLRQPKLSPSAKAVGPSSVAREEVDLA
ncbi:MAG: XdhC family protein [Verrucomicrobiota bacterium]